MDNHVRNRVIIRYFCYHYINTPAFKAPYKFEEIALKKEALFINCWAIS